MLRSDNVPLADTAFFTIVMDYTIRSKAVVSAGAVMMEETGSRCSASERYGGETVSTHHTVQSVVSLRQKCYRRLADSHTLLMTRPRTQLREALLRD